MRDDWSALHAATSMGALAAALTMYRACHVSQGCSLQRSTLTEVVAVQTILDGADLSMATFATCAPPCYVPPYLRTADASLAAAHAAI